MIEIRKAEPKDISKINEYTKKVGGETNNLSYGSEGILMTLDIMNLSPFYTAWVDDELVGVSNLSKLPRRMSHVAKFGISVLKSKWGMGIGSKFIEKIIEEAKNMNIEIIMLEVIANNYRAIKLYEKFGFIKTGTIPMYHKINDEYFDCNIMYLKL